MKINNNKIKEEKVINIIKIIIAITVGIALFFLALKMLPTFKLISTQEGREQFISNARKKPQMSYIILFALELTQILFCFIPGEPIELLSGILLGPFKGFVFILITSTLIYYSIFILVKKYGKKALKYLITKKEDSKIRRLSKSKIFNNKKYIEYILIVIYLMPGTPKDFIALISGLFPIDNFKYLLIVILARIPSILSSTMFSGTAISGNILYGILYYLINISIALVIICILIRKDKKKIAKGALDEININ